MKYLTYIIRNARRNPVRSLLTIASLSVCLFLMMCLISFFAINDDVAEGLKIHNRVVVMSSQGFAARVPIALASSIAQKPGVVATTPFSWYGGKLGEERMPFAQFGVYPDTFLKIYDEFSVPEDQQKAWQEDRAGCLVGRKLAADRNWKLGEKVPLKGDLYPIDLDLTIRAIYDGPSDTDLRTLYFNWNYLNELLKRASNDGYSDNAGTVFLKANNPDRLESLITEIDEEYKNSDTPTKTQTEEAFVKMFSEYFGSLKDLIRAVGAVVVISLVLVAGNAMAMSTRERTTEISVLKAIGFTKGRVLFLVLAEAVLVAGLGGLIGAIGTKFLFDYFDVSRFTGGFLPFFYVPWNTALTGLGLSLIIGLLSGIIPAYIASRRSVIDGLRKVV